MAIPNPHEDLTKPWRQNMFDTKQKNHPAWDGSLEAPGMPVVGRPLQLRLIALYRLKSV